MQFDSTVNVAEEMNGVALCDEAADIVLKNCPTAEAQKALLKILKNYDAPKDQVREALLWTKNGDVLRKTSPAVPAYSHLDDSKYVEWKRGDLKNQADRVAAHNAKVVAEYMKDDDSYGILTLQRALSTHAERSDGNSNGISPAVVAHFLDSHPAVVRKDGVFLVEVRDFQQKSWYLMPASEKMSFFKRVKIFFKLIFGAR